MQNLPDLLTKILDYVLAHQTGILLLIIGLVLLAVFLRWVSAQARGGLLSIGRLFLGLFWTIIGLLISIGLPVLLIILISLFINLGKWTLNHINRLADGQPLIQLRQPQEAPSSDEEVPNEEPQTGNGFPVIVEIIPGAYGMDVNTGADVALESPQKVCGWSPTYDNTLLSCSNVYIGTHVVTNLWEVPTRGSP